MDSEQLSLLKFYNQILVGDVIKTPPSLLTHYLNCKDDKCHRCELMYPHPLTAPMCHHFLKCIIKNCHECESFERSWFGYTERIERNTLIAHRVKCTDDDGCSECKMFKTINLNTKQTILEYHIKHLCDNKKCDIEACPNYLSKQEKNALLTLTLVKESPHLIERMKWKQTPYFGLKKARNNRWSVYVGDKNYTGTKSKVKHIGVFNTEEEAAEAYDKEKLRLNPLIWDDKLNFPHKRQKYIKEHEKTLEGSLGSHLNI